LWNRRDRDLAIVSCDGNVGHFNVPISLSLFIVLFLFFYVLQVRLRERRPH